MSNILLRLPLLKKEEKLLFRSAIELLCQAGKKENLITKKLNELIKESLDFLGEPLRNNDFYANYTDLRWKVNSQHNFILKVFNNKKIEKDKKINFIVILWENYSNLIGELRTLFKVIESEKEIKGSQEKYNFVANLFLNVFKDYFGIFNKLDKFFYKNENYMRLHFFK